MFGMDFISFLILLVISAVVAGVLHYGLKYYVIAGTGSYLSKVVIGWIGAWLGSPIFGHWWGGLMYGPDDQPYRLYYVPAILGAIAILVLAVDVTKTFTSAGRRE